MDTKQIIVLRSFEKDMKGLHRNIQEAFYQKLALLVKDPFFLVTLSFIAACSTPTPGVSFPSAPNGHSSLLHQKDPPETLAFPVYEKNVQEGFAATAGFEIITGKCLPKKGQVAPSGCAVYQETVTYRLDPDADAYKIEADPLAPLQWITLAWRKQRDQSPFVFDFFLHGKVSDLAIRVADLDIRKFLHQSIVPIAGDSPLARAQAYFEEFSRKAKVIYPLPPENPQRHPSAFSHKQNAINDLRREIRGMLEELPEEAEMAQPLRQALRLLQQDNQIHLEAVRQNLTLARDISKSQKGERQRDHESLFLRLIQKVLSIGATESIADLKITNNCREPGNYEVEARDRVGRYLFRGSFSFPTRDYHPILTRFHGLGIREQGTGIGAPKTIRNREKLRYWDSFLPWNWIKKFPRVTLNALSQIHGDEVSHAEGKIKQAHGRIPFEEYEVDQEVWRKSRPHWLGEEPLTYIRVNKTLPLPSGFEPPAGAKPAGFLPQDTAPTAYWTANENQDKIVPHHFRTFEEIQRYDLFMSEFSLNGVYKGQSDLEKDFNWEREKGRWPFTFRYLSGLNRFEIRQWRWPENTSSSSGRCLGDSGYTEIRLINDGADHPIHFVLGNFCLQPGESTEFLFGLGTQPLIMDYNDNPYQEPLLYALAYDNHGTILDHHDRKIGVEKVMITRIDNTQYKVRLISYERILPVWEGILQ